MKEVFMTTIDNPFDYFNDFDNWYRWDEEHGYHTCSRLARVAFPSQALSVNENTIEMERAIDEFIKNEPTKLYKKVYRT